MVAVRAPRGMHGRSFPCGRSATRAVILLAGATFEPPRTMLAGSSNAPSAICSALEPLAATLAPDKMVVECGSGGTCGPNSLSHVLTCAGLHDGDGDEIRRRVVAHGKQLLHARAVWEPEDGAIEELSVRSLLEDSFASWAIPGQNTNRVGGKFDWGGPRHVLTAENWLKHMAEPTTWIDQAFLSLAADCFAVEIAYHIVSSTGKIGRTSVIKPREAVDVLARVELAYVVDQHFCAVSAHV